MTKHLLAMSDKLRSARWAVNSRMWNPIHADILVASSGIQPEEKTRINQYVFMKDAKKTLIGRLLMRNYIHESTGLPWSDITLDRDQNNKPLLKKQVDPPVHFNISHDGNFVVLAGEVGNVKLGIDVMEMAYKGGKKIQEFFRIMTRHFSPDEWMTIKGYSSDENQQIKMFFRHWCLKESYVKAVGTGLTENLQEINFRIKTRELEVDKFTEDTELFLMGKKQENWLFQETLLSDNHCVAVALSASDLTIFKGQSPSFSVLNFQNLVEKCEIVSPPDENYCKDFLKKECLPE